MRFYATLDENRYVISSMMTNWLSDEYIESNNMVELSEEDYSSIENLSRDHAISLDENGFMQIYQKVDHGIQLANLHINELVTNRIKKGFNYNGFNFGCSLYDQMNINNKVGYGGTYVTSDGEEVYLDDSQSLEIKKAMMLHVEHFLDISRTIKNSLMKAESFEDIANVREKAVGMLK